ncbi:hypothetical protein ACFLZ5_06665 [Thermodesulfobacteriota bacterium]
MFKKIRIAILLFILFLVGGNAYLTQLRITDWDQSLAIVIYPINADGSPYSANYIASLDLDTLKPIERFLQTEGRRFNLELVDPVSIDLAPEIKNLPPSPPFGEDLFAIMWWSLQMRYWAWKHDTYSGPLTNIQVFVLYHDPEIHVRLSHSLGLKKGHIVMVNAFATRHQAAQNNVIIVHEMLHTLGATDKYNLQTLQPRYPEGYAEPDKIPLLPQENAEIMGGAIPLSQSESKTPDSLFYTVIGPSTAKEIKWLK